jgi:hypothetical protein
MSDPRRLLDEASGFDRALLESATLDSPSPERRARAIAALSAGTATIAATTTTSGKGLAGLGTWKVVIGLAAVGAIGIGVGRARRAQPAAVPSVVVAKEVAIPAPTAQPTLVAPPTASPSPVPAPITKHVAVATASPAPSLTRELALLDEARSAISAAAPAKALAALDRYDAECAGGAMTLEARVLRIEAIAASGDSARASAMAKKFLADHPGTQYAARLNKHVKEDS